MLGEDGRHEEFAAVVALHTRGVLETAFELFEFLLSLLHVLELELEVPKGQRHNLIRLCELGSEQSLGLAGVA